MSQFFVDSSDVNINSGTAVLRNEEARHLCTVHRARQGEEIALFDGNGNRWLGIFEGGDSTQAYLKNLKTLPSNEPGLSIELAIALPKTGWENVIDKGVQLGVEKFQPIETVRSVARIAENKKAAKLDRWNKITKASAKQCERGIIPEVRPPLKLKEFLQHIGEPVKGELRLFLAERFTGEANEPKSPLPPSIVRLAVGPEGGWTDLENEKLINSAFMPISLGGRILRTEAAALAGVAIIQARWGDLAKFFPTR